MPRWMVPVVAVGLGAPIATLGVYVLSVGGNISEFVMSPPRLWGFLWLAGSGLVFGLLMALGASVRERLAQVRAQALEFELERSRLEKQAVDARLSLLQAQIEPHFLFNTLANVQALVEAGSPRAAEVLKSLIAYLRAAMPRLHDQQATLADELALVKAYLELMRMRMPDRLDFALAVPPELHQRSFPPMALLTLVENAVKHGIDPSEDGGRIEIGAREGEDRSLRLWVADTGVGMDEQVEPGTGLSNLQDRLQAMYGAAASLQLMELPPHGVRAELHLPEVATHA
jgi:LytS/YehU family sensor histidine kinase